jgi:hypothetical protein
MARDDFVQATAAEAKVRIEAARARRAESGDIRYGRSNPRGRKLGALSAPAGLIALCVALGVAFALALGQAGAQLEPGRIVPLALALPVEAALFAFPVLTPLILIVVHRMHWRLMRGWLRRVAQVVLLVWAAAAGMMAFALL